MLLFCSQYQINASMRKRKSKSHYFFWYKSARRAIFRALISIIKLQRAQWKGINSLYLKAVSDIDNMYKAPCCMQNAVRLGRSFKQPNSSALE